MKSQLWLLALVGSSLLAGCGQPQRPVPVRTGEVDFPAEPTIELPAEPATAAEPTVPAEPKSPAEPPIPAGPKTPAVPDSTPPATDKPAAENSNEVTR